MPKLANNPCWNRGRGDQNRGKGRGGQGRRIDSNQLVAQSAAQAGSKRPRELEGDGMADKPSLNDAKDGPSAASTGPGDSPSESVSVVELSLYPPGLRYAADTVYQEAAWMRRGPLRKEARDGMDARGLAAVGREQEDVADVDTNRLNAMLDDDSLNLFEDDIDEAAYDAHVEQSGDTDGAKDAAALETAETDEEFDDRIKERLARYWERAVTPFFAPLSPSVLEPIVWHARRRALRRRARGESPSSSVEMALARASFADTPAWMTELTTSSTMGDCMEWDDPAAAAASCLLPFIGEPVGPREAAGWGDAYRGRPFRSSAQVSLIRGLG